MSSLMRALATLRPGVNCSPGDRTAAGIRYDEPLPEGFVRPTQEEIDAALLGLDQEARCDAVDALYQEKLLAGFLYEGKRYEIDDGSQSKIGNLALTAGFSIINMPSVTWEPTPFIAADNSATMFATAEDYMSFANAAKDAFKAVFAKRYALKVACRAATTAEDLASIDIAAGWPDV